MTALKSYIQGLKTADAAALNKQAWELFIEHKAAEGWAPVDRALALKPADANILDTRGQIYLAMGKIEDAFIDLDSAIRSGIKDPGTYFGRGQCYERLGKSALAIDDYRTALRLPSTQSYHNEVQAKAKEGIARLESAPAQRTVKR